MKERQREVVREGGRGTRPAQRKSREREGGKSVTRQGKRGAESSVSGWDDRDRRDFNGILKLESNQWLD